MTGLVATAITAVALAASGGGIGEGLPDAPAVRCDVVAALDGSDRGDGSAERPVRTVGRLLKLVRRGGTACLRSGRFHEDVKIARDGITLRSAPSGWATLQGRLWITRTATGVRITDLRLDGRNRRNLPSPTVNGSRAVFLRDEVTNRRTGICFLLGGPRYGRPSGTTIARSRIHACGRQPSTNRDHGIYVAWADRTTIADNVIYDNADRGVQLYPDASRTRITGNIVHGNGEGLIFSGEGGVSSRGTTVEGNIISGSRLRSDVESYYPSGTPPGTGNTVRGNCVFGGRKSTIDRSGGGFSAFANLEADPRFLAPERGDFRLAPGSQCARLMADSRAPAGRRGQVPVAPR